MAARRRAASSFFAFAVVLAATSVASCDNCSAPATRQADTDASSREPVPSPDADSPDASSQLWPPPHLHSSWSATLDGTGAQHGKSITRAPDGTTFVSFDNQFGSFTAGAKPYAGDRQSATYGGYVASFDPSGHATWAYALPNDGVPTSIGDLAVDAKNDLVLLAHWSTTLCNPPCRLLDKPCTDGSSGLVVAKIKPGTRDAIWTRTLSTTGAVGGQTVVIDRQGNLFVWAWFDGDLRSADIDLTASAPAGQRESLLVKLSPGGNLLWLVHAPLVKEPESPDHHLVIDRNNHVWTSPSPTATALVSRLDDQGHPALSLTPHILGTANGPEDGIHARLLADFPDGSLAILGVLQNVRVELDGNPLTADATRRLFIASFTPDGALRFARTLDAIGDHDLELEHMIGLADDTLVVTGGSADFGATLAVIPRAGTPVVFRHPLASMQLEGLERIGLNELLVAGSKQTDVRFDYRVLAQRLTLGKP